MLNPFIIGQYQNWKKSPRLLNEERHAQTHGTLLHHPVVRNRLTLRLGGLLIRMGKELTGEAVFPAISTEAWTRGNPSEPRPAHFHHAG